MTSMEHLLNLSNGSSNCLRFLPLRNQKEPWFFHQTVVGQVMYMLEPMKLLSMLDLSWRMRLLIVGRGIVYWDCDYCLSLPIRLRVKGEICSGFGGRLWIDSRQRC